MLESGGSVDDGSDWGSDFDDEIIEAEEESTLKTNGSLPNKNTIGGQSQRNTVDASLYEIPDGKPSICNSKPSLSGIVPEWLRNVEHHQGRDNPDARSLSPTDENLKPYPGAVYIENVLLPTRASKDEESKNFIETLKRKLSQKAQLAGVGTVQTNSFKSKEDTTNTKVYKSISPLKVQQQFLTENPLQSQQTNNPELNPEQIRKIKESLNKFPWFYKVDRNKAELILENYTSDGSFLVRECHHGGPTTPFTLTIRYGQRLFHIQIRVRTDLEFALGTKKQNEMHFTSVQDMVETYRKTPLQLHTNGKFFGETKLTNPPIVYSLAH